MAKAGQPTKYKKEFNEISYKLCSKHGYTDEELADSLNVSEASIQNWKAEYPDFLASIKKGKAEFDDTAVVQALHKRATGYTRTVERVSKEGIVACSEEMPPDPTSMIFWLKNRNPEKWRDRQEIEHSGIEVILGVKQKKD